MPYDFIVFIYFSNSLLVESSGCSLYKILTYASSDCLLLPFQFVCFFIPFSCLITLTRTSNTMLNKSGKSGHPCLVPDFRGIAFRFSPLSMMLAVGLSYMTFTILRYISSISISLRVFVRNEH